MKSDKEHFSKEYFEKLREQLPKNEKGGTKNDAGKIRPALIDPEFLEEMAYVLTKGAEVHGDYNWQKLEIDRIQNSLFRHMLKYLSGQLTDEDYPNGQHLAAIAVNAMFLYYLEKENQNESKKNKI